MQVQTSILKSNADAEKFAVQTLLGGQARPRPPISAPASAAISNVTA